MSKNNRRGPRRSAGKNANSRGDSQNDQKSNPQKSASSKGPRSESGRTDKFRSAKSGSDDESRPQRGAREDRADGGGFGKNKKSKKVIKNARSLADVVGGGKGGGGRASFRPPQERSNFGSGSSPSRPGPANPEKPAAEEKPKSMMSKALTYIMSFQPKSDARKAEDAEKLAQETREKGARIIAGQRMSQTQTPPKSEQAQKRQAPNREKLPGQKRPQAAAEQPSRAPVRQGKQKQTQDEDRDQDRSQRRGKGRDPKQDQKHDSKSNQQQAQKRQEPRRAPDRSKTQAPAAQAKAPRAEGDYSWPRDRVPSAGAAPITEKMGRGRGQRPDDETVQGIVKRHPDGYGFLIPDDSEHPDVYISRQSMTGVMTNDRVEATVYKMKAGQRGSNSKEDRLSGEIVGVISRANKTIVGKYLPVDQKYGVILDENRGWGADLRIEAKDSMNAKEGEVVAVEVIHYPGHDQEFTGKVTGIIGDIDNPLNDVIRVIHQQGIPMEFSGQALAEARKFGEKVTDQEAKGREDLTKIDLITIDGATARDFDDAVYTEQTETGFRLIVAIADVSHYVKPGTPLDQEAYERGTSTYFPNFVVPMLPEELSNELCSLKPHVRRLCFCCEMQINFTGDVEKYRFFEGVMESKARVTYGQAQEVIDAHTAAAGGKVERNENVQKLKHVEGNILRSADLAKILMAKRFREGSLDLEIPETQVVVDTSGESVDVIKSERLFAHRLIEELMLITNICTARILEEKGVPGIFRIHEEPEEENLEALQRYLWNFGGSSSVVGSANLQKKLSKALQQMEGKPEAQILNILTLRTMKQAHYSHENVGHFGLGFTQYSHFTSPIRRYPDLIAHRIIKSQIYPKYKAMQMSEDDLASATLFLSACEQRSTKAERKIVSIKKARFMKKFVGEQFEGIISSVAKFGVFVLLRQFDVDGMIKIEKLGNDRFMFDDQNLRLIGNRTGQRYSIGDLVRVEVVNVDVEQGKIDFELPEDELARKGEETYDDDDDFSDRETSKDRTRKPGRKDDQKKKSSKGRGGKTKSAAGESKGGKGKGQSKKQDDKKAGSPKSGSVQKRGSTENDSRSVRKERVSKRSGKN